MTSVPQRSRAPTARPNAVLDDSFNSALVGLLLFGFGLAYTVCWLGLGPQTLAWGLLRASGAVSYLFLALTVSAGALLGSRLAPPWLSRAHQAGWHGVTSGFALALAVAHGLFLTVDHQSPQTLSAVWVPFTATILPVPLGLGTLGLYGLALVILSTQLRRRLGNIWWKRLHFLAYPAFLLATLHGMTAGTDALAPLYAMSIAAVTFTLGLRVCEGKSAGPKRSGKPKT